MQTGTEVTQRTRARVVALKFRDASSILDESAGKPPGPILDGPTVCVAVGEPVGYVPDLNRMLGLIELPPDADRRGTQVWLRQTPERIRSRPRGVNDAWDGEGWFVIGAAVILDVAKATNGSPHWTTLVADHRPDGIPDRYLPEV